MYFCDMKKMALFLFYFGLSTLLYSQPKQFTGTIYNAESYLSISEACVYNMRSNLYSFSNLEGVFYMQMALNDTLIISNSLFRQKIVVIEASEYNRGRVDIFLYHRSIMLPKVVVVGMSPTYEGFKRDIAQTKLPDSYKNLEDVHLTDEQRRDATFQEEAPNVLKGTKLGSPITYLYSTFNKKMKMKQLYYEMESYGDEIYQVPQKYNKELVKQITRLEDEELMEFMVFCRFSYYDLVRWSAEQISAAISTKFDEYQYFKAVELLEEEK